MSPTPAASAPLVELQGVSRTYGHGEAAVEALRGIDLAIAAGDFVAMMGPSGSGKSTCMNILGCLDRPSSGTHRFQGIDVGQLSQDERALVRRHSIGFVFQGFNLLARTSALENVELPLIYRGVRAQPRRARALAALAAVGLADRARHAPNELSGGQQQRVAIARAIAAEPSVLFADEPTGNLDTARGHELMQLLAALNRERALTIVMVTHELEMAAYARRTIHFRDGHIEVEAPP